MPIHAVGVHVIHRARLPDLLFPASSAHKSYAGTVGSKQPSRRILYILIACTVRPCVGNPRRVKLFNSVRCEYYLPIRVVYACSIVFFFFYMVHLCLFSRPFGRVNYSSVNLRVIVDRQCSHDALSSRVPTAP